MPPSPRPGRIAGAGLTAALLLAGCSGASPDRGVPVIRSEGSRIRDHRSLQDLADWASALVIAEPVGTWHDVPLPDGHGDPDSAPTRFVTLDVTQVVSGTVEGRTIDVVSPGTDEGTGEPALLDGGPYLIFLAPAMYDRGDPAGGYVAVGGPAGVFAADREGLGFLRMDEESPDLPARIPWDRERSGTPSGLPAVSRTEAELLAEGP